MAMAPRALKSFLLARTNFNVLLNKNRMVSFFTRKGNDSTAQNDIEGASSEQEDVHYDAVVPLPPSKSYTPSKDVEADVLVIAQEFTSKKVRTNTPMSDNFFKYKVLSKCMKTFNFTIPSYELGEMETLGDVISYYSVARNPVSPEERLKNSDLPSNVHLQLEPFRFTDETKHIFDGKTAFPQRDTVVTSLKYRNIYKGYKNPKKYTEKEGFQYY